MRVMAMLGAFVFSANVKEFHKITKNTSYSYASIPKINAPTEYHAIGGVEQDITLSGRINALTAGSNPFFILEGMAKLKVEYPLFLGNGRYLGNFIVRGVQENGDKIFDNGVAIEIGFNIRLTRTDGGILSWISSLAHIGGLL